MSWRNTCQSLQKRVVLFLIESTFFFGCFLHLWVISHARKARKIKVMTTVTFAKQSLSKLHKMDNRLSWSLRLANNFQSEVVLVFSHLETILVNTSYHLTILIPSLRFLGHFPHLRGEITVLAWDIRSSPCWQTDITTSYPDSWTWM